MEIWGEWLGAVFPPPSPQVRCRLSSHVVTLMTHSLTLIVFSFSHASGMLKRSTCQTARQPQHGEDDADVSKDKWRTLVRRRW